MYREDVASRAKSDRVTLPDASPIRAILSPQLPSGPYNMEASRNQPSASGPTELVWASQSEES